MTNSLSVRVYQERQLLYSDDFSGDIELGRQDRGEAPPFTRLTRDGRDRLVIAGGDENEVSRRHVRFELRPDGRVRLTNINARQPVLLQNGREVGPGATCDLALPVVLSLGRKTVRVQAIEAPVNLLSLPVATMPPRRALARSARFPGLAIPAGGSIDSKELLKWLQTAMDVLQAAADSADFFERAAEAALAMAGLDSGRVLLLGPGGEWRPTAVRLADSGDTANARAPSRLVLARMREGKRTYYEVPVDQESVLGLAAVVAAPILDRNGEVLGAIYGERTAANVGPLTEVEAMLVELLARGVAAGLARLEQEQAALRERVRFEQFFSPELARQLSQRPDMLQGCDREVSVLFCDVRGFSRITERMGAERALKWINDLLDVLSACVLAEGGVLVDYIGDELMAMWGAPEDQPDHAVRACRAALAMLARLPELNQRWQASLEEPLAVGIGVNTGQAQVGNIGSCYKFKYGAMGNTVNVASRVQGATKYMKCSLLIAAATHALLDADFAARRLGRFQVVNITEPVELYELGPQDRPLWDEARTEYERALGLFEKGEFGPAVRTLGNWRVKCPDDDTALVLLYRAVRCMVEGPSANHPVMVLAEK